MFEKLTIDEIRELANVFGVSVGARHLLEDAGLSRSQIPAVSDGNAENFWREVSVHLGGGLIDYGRWRVLNAALQVYRFNRVFQDGADKAQSPPGSGPGPGSRSPGQATRPEPSAAPYAASSEPPYGEAFPFTIVALDARSYSKQTLPMHVDWRTAIRDITATSARRCGIAAEALTMQDTGDGVLAGLRPEVSKRLIAAEFLSRLRDELRAYNRVRTESARLRLRASVHYGETVVHETGFAGDAAVVAARLVDAQPTRAVLETMPAVDLAVILSDQFYRDTVGHGLFGLDPRDYRREEVAIPKFTGVGWLYVPGYDISAVPPTPAPGGAAEADRESRVPPPPSDPRAAGVSPTQTDAAGTWDFLVSYAPHANDKQWAEWIAWKLEARGYRVHLEAWDGLVGSNVAGRVDAAVSGSRQTIVVLSSNYVESGRHQADWYSAWERDPQGAKRLLIPVRVEKFNAPGLLHGIVPVDLFDLDDDEAHARLVQKIEQALEGRAKPSTTPPFPGGRRR